MGDKHNKKAIIFIKVWIGKNRTQTKKTGDRQLRGHNSATFIHLKKHIYLFNEFISKGQFQFIHGCFNFYVKAFLLNYPVYLEKNNKKIILSEKQCYLAKRTSIFQLNNVFCKCKPIF